MSVTRPWRRSAVIAATVGALGAVVLTACSSGGSPTAQSTPTMAVTPSATPNVSSTASTTPSRSASPAPTTSLSDIPANHADFGYIRAVKHRNGSTYLVFDRATFYTGAAANTAAAGDGFETPVPNDYYISNKNAKLRELPVSASVELYESIAMAGRDPAGERGPFSDLEKFLTTRPDVAKITPFHLHYDAHGRVDRVQEQYIP